MGQTLAELMKQPMEREREIVYGKNARMRGLRLVLGFWAPHGPSLRPNR